MDESTSLGSMPLFMEGGGMRHFGGGMHMLQLWSNICIIESGDGLVLFDAGFEFNGPRLLEEIRAISEEPVRYIIYGHGHADHAFGAGSVIDEAEERGYPKPVIVAHECLPARFDRYRLTLPYQEHINRIQFSISEGIPAFSHSYIYPDETYGDELSLSLGDITLELRHARGETDDMTWLWIPERKAACVSDLWVSSCPNIGNPFKVQRYTLEWAQALEEVAGRSPELLLPGHGAALSGEEEIRDACLAVAGALRCLHDQVVEMLNRGMWPEEILHSFEWPDEFAKSPYLASIYGHPYFIVKALLRQYHGWYDGNPSHLFPSSRGEIAGQVLELTGSAAKMLERARALADKGQIQLALHVVDFLIDAGADQRGEALELKAGFLESLAEQEKSLIARNIFLAGARRIRELEFEG